ncbi:hypothetical protein CsSME_00019901 [Camellia sinensis var. sinensis]
MTLSFVGSRSLFPSPWARIISNKMPRHKLLSKALSSKRETTSSEPNPANELSWSSAKLSLARLGLGL